MTIALDPFRKRRLAVAGVTLVSVIAARVADVATTLHFNPTLSREANPFVSILGFDVTQLIVSNVIVVLVGVIAPLLVYMRYGPAKMDLKPQTLSEYISIQLYRCRLERRRLLSGLFLGWPLPKDWLQTVRLFGFAISWGTVFGSLHFTFGWWAINAWDLEWYSAYRSLIHFRVWALTPYISIILFLFIASYVFFRMEFKSQAPEPPGAEQGSGNGGKHRA